MGKTSFLQFMIHIWKNNPIHMEKLKKGFFIMIENRITPHIWENSTRLFYKHDEKESPPYIWGKLLE